MPATQHFTTKDGSSSVSSLRPCFQLYNWSPGNVQNHVFFSPSEKICVVKSENFRIIGQLMLLKCEYISPSVTTQLQIHTVDLF